MSYGFVAYIDESGDDGLKKVKPIDPNGSSEWFVLSAAVVRARNENAVGRWQREILAKFRCTQRADIHYRKLTHPQKLTACGYIAQQEIRLFVAMSNKKNMKGYVNPQCYQEPYYFYWWMTRLLLERVTKFCANKSMSIYKEYRPIKFMFSQRGGMSYPRLLSYLNLIRFQSSAGSLYLTAGDLAWSVVDLNLIYDIAHKNEAGVQLADVVAGAFYEAVSIDRKGPPNPKYATLLIPRLYRGSKGLILGHGVKVMPQPNRASLLESQRTIFEAVGFPRGKW